METQGRKDVAKTPQPKPAVLLRVQRGSPALHVLGHPSSASCNGLCPTQSQGHRHGHPSSDCCAKRLVLSQSNITVIYSTTSLEGGGAEGRPEGKGAWEEAATVSPTRVVSRATSFPEPQSLQLGARRYQHPPCRAGEGGAPHMGLILPPKAQRCVQAPGNEGPPL